MSAHVRAQVSGHSEGAVADGTEERLVTEVDSSHVTLQSRRAVEPHRAVAARERSFPTVRPLVHPQSTERAESPRTVRALVRSDAGVDARVQRQQRRVLEASAAVGADVRSGVRVRALVVRARAVLREALRAAVDAADERFLAGMRAHVRSQRRRRAELTPTLAAHARTPVTVRTGGTGGCRSGSGAVGRCV